jgi:hypothetical protein
MIQTMVFYACGYHPQIACNQVAHDANVFLKEHHIDKEHFISSTTNFQTGASEGGPLATECTITLVVDVPEPIIDELTLRRTVDEIELTATVEK